MPTTPDGSRRHHWAIRRAAADRSFLDLPGTARAHRRLVSHNNRASNFAPKAFVKWPDAQGYTAREFEIAMSRLFEPERIRMAPYGRPGDARQRIVREPETTHGTDAMTGASVELPLTSVGDTKHGCGGLWRLPVTR